MDHQGDGKEADDFRHEKLGQPAEPKRLRGLRWGSYVHRAAIRQAGVEVLAPFAVLVAVGLAILFLDEAGDWRFVGEACITGAVVTGGFAWISAFNSVVESDRDRQLDLGSASALNYADLAGLELAGIYLRHAELTGARLSGAKGRHIDMHGATLVDARLTDARLPGGNFTNADMTGAGCYQADFRKADLRDATLEGASLGKANLSHAKLDGADMRRADLRGADLRGATLHRVNLNGAWYSPSTKFPIGFDPHEHQMTSKSSRDGVDERRCDCRTRVTDLAPTKVIDLDADSSALDEQSTPAEGD